MGNATERCRAPWWWHPDLVGLVFRLVEFLLVLVPLVGVVYAIIKAVSVARGRQAERLDAPSPATSRSPSLADKTPATQPPTGARSHAYSMSTTERMPAG